MDSSVIRGLRLKEAFEDIQKFQTVQSDADLLTELFEWTNRGLVFIHDDEYKGHSVFITDTKGLGADKIFRIDNAHHKEIFLWHIDGVLYSKGSKCDCAFIAEGHLGFVEFKSNAANNTGEAVKDNYEKAGSQLTLTFQDVKKRCNNVNVDILSGKLVEAYAVFNRTVPRNNAHQKKVSAQFLKDNDIPLYFRNSVALQP